MLEQVVEALLQLENILEIVKEIFGKIITAIMGYLPGSPFQKFVSMMPSIPYLPELNWFVPVAEIVEVTALWLSFIGVYYTYSALLRFVRVIK